MKEKLNIKVIPALGNDFNKANIISLVDKNENTLSRFKLHDTGYISNISYNEKEHLISLISNIVEASKVVFANINEVDENILPYSFVNNNRVAFTEASLNKKEIDFNLEDLELVDVEDLNILKEFGLVNIILDEFKKEIGFKVTLLLNENNILGYVAYNDIIKQIYRVEIKHQYRGNGLGRLLIQNILDESIWCAISNHIYSGFFINMGAFRKSNNVYLLCGCIELEEFAKSMNSFKEATIFNLTLLLNDKFGSQDKIPNHYFAELSTIKNSTDIERFVTNLNR